MTSATAEAPTPTAPLQLYADVSEGGEVESVIPVRWCVSPSLIEEIKEQGATDAHVLLVITNGLNEMDRKLVPLTAEMTYLRFTRSGENKVTALVVWKEPWKLMRKARGGGFVYPVTDRYHGGTEAKVYGTAVDSTGYDLWTRAIGEDIRRLPGQDELHVQVPVEMFAKEPPEWAKRVATFAFGDYKDQCGFKKRFLATVIGGFILSPLLIAGVILLAVGEYVTLTLMTIVFLFAGLRGVSLNGFRHPIDGGPAALWRNVDRKNLSSIWWAKPGKNPGEHLRHPFFWIMNPPALAAAIGLGYLANAAFHLHWAWLRTLVVALIAPTFGAVIATIFATAILSYQKATADRRKAKEQRRRKEHDDKFLNDLNALVCNGYRDPKLSALPAEKRTVKLRYQNLKSKVCRTYSQ